MIQDAVVDSVRTGMIQDIVVDSVCAGMILDVVDSVCFRTLDELWIVRVLE